MNDDDDEDFETVYMTHSGVITVTEDAYQYIGDAAALEERQQIIKWLRCDHHVMTHTAWALAKAIEDGEHLK